jgi:hypothetical protein
MSWLVYWVVGLPPPPLKYLGIPLGASYKAKSIWDGIVEKMERQSVGKECLCPWKVGSSLLRELFPTYLRTYCPSSPFLLVWLTELRSSNKVFYGEG